MKTCLDDKDGDRVVGCYSVGTSAFKFGKATSRLREGDTVELQSDRTHGHWIYLSCKPGLDNRDTDLGFEYILSLLALFRI